MSSTQQKQDWGIAIHTEIRVCVTTEKANSCVRYRQGTAALQPPFVQLALHRRHTAVRCSVHRHLSVQAVPQIIDGIGYIGRYLAPHRSPALRCIAALRSSDPAHSSDAHFGPE